MAAGDVIKVIRGIAGTIFSFGFGSTKVQIKNDSGAFEMRNNDDTAYVITRGLDPVGAQDYVTKAYGDANYAGEATAVKVIQFSIALVSVGSTATIPTGAQVFKAQLDIDTAYDNSATIDLGNAATADLILDQTENDPSFVASYLKEQNTNWPLTENVEAVVGNAPTVGASTATVWYAEPAA